MQNRVMGKLEFGNLIKTRRIELGLSNAEAAHAAGLTTTMLSDFEGARKSRFPSPAELDGLSGALQLSQAKMLRELGYNLDVPANRDDQIPGKQKALLELVRRKDIPVQVSEVLTRALQGLPDRQ